MRAKDRARLPGTPSPMHRWTGADNLQIAGDSWGTPGGPLVVLLHGGGQTRHAWKGTGALLGKVGCYAVALDARGHGDSDWSPSGDYSSDAMVRDLRAVLCALGSSKPVLIGASMGGITSLTAVGEAAVDAAALILVDVVPKCEPEGVERIKSFMGQSPDGFTSLDDVATAVSRYQPQRAKPASTKGLAKNLRLSPDGRYHWHWDPRFLDMPYDLSERYQRLSACARRLRLPTLVARGAASDVVTDEGVKDFLASCPTAESLDVANAGHMVAGDQNDLFGQAAWAFLQRHLQFEGLQHPST